MKKRMLFSLIAMFSISLFFSCEEDDITEVSKRPFVSFQDNDYLTASEASTDLMEIVIYTDKPSSSPILVDYEILGDGSGFEVVSGPQITIPANSDVGRMIIQPVDDNMVQADRVSTIQITGVSGDYNVGFLTDRSYKKEITITNDDCGLISEGTYSTSNTGTWAGDYSVTVEIVETYSDISAKYKISDITMGTYAIGYGSADNPGIFVQNNCGLQIIEAESPDVVYGGDAFFGSGSFNGNDQLVIDWANSYGDTGSATLTLQ